MTLEIQAFRQTQKCGGSNQVNGIICMLLLKVYIFLLGLTSYLIGHC